MEIAETWKIRTDVLNELLSDVQPAPDGSVWWFPDLIPITDSYGSGYCVASSSGKIYYHTKDDTMSEALFPSFEAWLGNLADKFESGQFTMDDGIPWLSR